MNASDRPRRIVITGASRGLGLEFTRLWLGAGHHVFGLSRTARDTPALADLAATHPGALHLEACDVARDDSVDAAASAVATAWDAVDLLVNDAGVYGPRDSRLENLDLDEVRRVFEINALGPLRVTRALLPLLRKGRRDGVAHITSLMGSISDNSSGGAWPYRVSKTALNMVSRNMAHELQADNIASVVVHPGWVRTDMGGDTAPLSIEESVAAMAGTIDSVSMAQSGEFLDRDGNSIAW